MSQQELQQQVNKPIWQSPIRQDISITKHDESRIRTSQQGYNREARDENKTGTRRK